MSTDCVTDGDLVARARQGDPAAFGELVDRHRAAVYRAALAALRSPADAEDAAQDAFLLAYRRLDSFRGDASFKTWLLTIAWNQALTRRRRLSRWRLPGATRRAPETTTEEPAFDPPAPDPSPEDALAGARMQAAIREAIRALTPKLRDALLLAQSGEYAYGEIGAMLGAPVGTIKWRVSEARRHVREQLRARGYEHLV